MELHYAQQLFQGKRMDEVMHDIQFMNEKQVQELSERLFELTVYQGLSSSVYDELWGEISKRREYYLNLRRERLSKKIAEVGGFRHGQLKKAFIKRDDSLPAVQQVFGDIAVAVYQEELDHDNTVRRALTVYDANDSLQISCDAEDIVIEFANGARVEFSNSEWAAISRLK
jgi:hypothetical protein